MQPAVKIAKLEDKYHHFYHLAFVNSRVKSRDSDFRCIFFTWLGKEYHEHEPVPCTIVRLVWKGPGLWPLLVIL